MTGRCARHFVASAESVLARASGGGQERFPDRVQELRRRRNTTCFFVVASNHAEASELNLGLGLASESI